MNWIFVPGSTAQAKMLSVPQIPGIVTTEPKVANPFRQQKRLGQKPVMSLMLWVILLELLLAINQISLLKVHEVSTSQKLGEIVFGLDNIKHII